MAKNIVISLWFNTYRVDGECPDCGFDALIRAVAYHATASGVSTMADKTICGRCVNERGHDE